MQTRGTVLDMNYVRGQNQSTNWRNLHFHTSHCSDLRSERLPSSKARAVVCRFEQLDVPGLVHEDSKTLIVAQASPHWDQSQIQGLQYGKSWQQASHATLASAHALMNDTC